MRRFDPREVSRRDFLAASAAGALTLNGLSSAAMAAEGEAKAEKAIPETLVKQLFETLKPEQRQQVCFDWDHKDANRGLLRTRISNNWHITSPVINSAFFTGDQKKLIREIFEGVIVPEWHAKIDKQLQDDAGGFGNDQNIAIFGKPGEGKFEMVMTGRHMTLRCDGNSAENVAFGGPIFYGHAASGFDEEPGHPGNVFWEQALAANKVYDVLDGKQRKLAEVANTPNEEAVGFRGAKGGFPGIPLTELSNDQLAEVEKTLKILLAPYRQTDKDEVAACLKAQGGLTKCSMAFYTDDDIGSDRVWDNWRLEGPSFVWYFRGSPHVHVWANVSSDPNVALNA